MSWGHHRSGSDLDSALDSLGSISSSTGSWSLSGVPVRLHPLLTVKVDLSQLHEMTNPMPLQMSSQVLQNASYSMELERKALQLIKEKEKEEQEKSQTAAEEEVEEDRLREERKKKRAQLLEEERRKREEEEEKRRQDEEERKKRDQEEKLKQSEQTEQQEQQEIKARQRAEHEETSRKDNNAFQEASEGAPKSDNAAVPAPAIQAMQNLQLNSNVSSSGALPTVTGASASTSKLSANPKLNYSEFEGESDPFDSLELKSINEFQELAAVLQTTKANGVVPISVSTQQGGTPASSPYYPLSGQPTQRFDPYAGVRPSQAALPYPTSQNYIQTPSVMMNANPSLLTRQPLSMAQMPINQQQQRQPRPYPVNPVLPSQRPIPGQYPFTKTHPHLQYGVPSESSASMKGSKSIGDLVSEVNKEDPAMTLAVKEVRRKITSRTPPPRPASIGGNSVAAALEDWTPWPDLEKDRSQTVSTASSRLSTASNQTPKRSLLDALPSESRQLCQQVHDMGFPLDRVIFACQKVGSDTRKMINFCLTVDRVCNSIQGPIKGLEVEQAVLMRGPDESDEIIIKHMKAFKSLKEIGFDSMAIHNALFDCNNDHDKALEKLLK